MTRNEFQNRYHDYRTADRAAALAEAARVNTLAAGFAVVAVGFPLPGRTLYGLMLRTAAECLRGMGIQIEEAT